MEIRKNLTNVNFNFRNTIPRWIVIHNTANGTFNRLFGADFGAKLVFTDFAADKICKNICKTSYQ